MPKHIDNRSPPASKPSVTKVMKANKGKNTKVELALRKALRIAGLHGYRLHIKTIPGRPDIAFPKYKVAIFVNGCFWHRCPKCDLPLPGTNTTFWNDKFERNIERDMRKIAQLEEAGWKVLICWEHDIKNNPDGCARLIESTLVKSGYAMRKTP